MRRSTEARKPNFDLGFCCREKLSQSQKSPIFKHLNQKCWLVYNCYKSVYIEDVGIIFIDLRRRNVCLQQIYRQFIYKN